MTYVEKPLQVGDVVVYTRAYGIPLKDSPRFRMLEKVQEWDISNGSYWKVVVLDGKHTGKVVYTWNYNLMIAPNALPEKYTPGLPIIYWLLSLLAFGL